MHTKHIFLRVFSKIALFACVFCAFFISPVFATLPAGYTELEYIESTGTQYIDTGIKGELESQLKFVGQVTKYYPGGTYGHLWGDITDDTRAISFNTPQLSSTSATSRFGNIKTSISTSTAKVLPLNTTITVIQNKEKAISSNGIELIFNTTTDFTTSQPLILLATHNASGVTSARHHYKCEYYSHKIAGVLVQELIPAKRNSDDVIGMYDTVSGQFFENAGTGDFIAGPVAEIKIATTKMVDDEFAAAEAKLATTVQTIESVVSRTISQTEQIQILQDTKQTRPDESCPANMKCLLVQDEDGTPHWYPIIEP